MTTRSVFALLCGVGALWMTTHLPSGSAFAVSQNLSHFYGWQGALVVGSLIMSLIMARLLTRH